MSFDFFEQSMKELPSNLACVSASLGAVDWRQTAEAYCKSGGRLLSLWGADNREATRLESYAAENESNLERRPWRDTTFRNC